MYLSRSCLLDGLLQPYITPCLFLVAPLGDETSFTHPFVQQWMLPSWTTISSVHQSILSGILSSKYRTVEHGSYGSGPL